MAQYWLLKTEPSTYSYDDLVRDGHTVWNGIRNFQARNFLRNAKKGDRALLYHSGKDKAVVGVIDVIHDAVPEIDKSHPGEWFQIEIAPASKFSNPVTLATIKARKSLSGLLLLKQSRLSVSPVTPEHFAEIQREGGKK